MATATDMVWVELGRERTARGEITFRVAGKPKGPQGLITPTDLHWGQALQALEGSPLPAAQGKGHDSVSAPVITLLPREAVERYQAAFVAAAGR